jgi:hypothetical protein
MRYSSFILFAVIIVLSSCDYLGGVRISGNRQIATKEISAGSFESVEVHGSMNVHLVQSPTNSVKVQADDNLFEYLDIYTEGNRLVVKTRKGYNLRPSRDIIVYAAAANFKDIELSGSGDIFSENTITATDELSVEVSGSGDINMNVNVPRLRSKISGSGSLTLNGTAKDFSATINGSGDIKSFGLSADNARVDLAGSADAEVTANKTLEVEIAGSGSVTYKGNPSVKQHIAGSGSIEKVG